MKNVLLSKFILAAAMLFTALNAAHAQTSSDHVVAVVNKNVITKQDVDDRFDLTMRHMGTVRLTEGQKNNLYKKTLGDLINEELQVQYAKEIGVKNKASEVNLAIATIEKNNRLPAGAFYKISHGLEGTAKKQVEAEILWQKIVDRRVRPRVVISNAELDKLIGNLLGREILEKEVYQIFLSADSAENEDELKSKIKTLHNHLLNNPEKFDTIAQTSTEINAAEGGYLGWFGPGELSPALDSALADLNKGNFSEPIRSSAGWHILKVGETRSNQKFSLEPITQYKVLRYTRELPEGKKSAKRARKKFIKEVDDLERLSQIEGLIMKRADDEDYAGSQDLGWMNEGDMPMDHLETVRNMEKGEFSDVIESDNRVTILHLAGAREQMPEKLRQYRERVRSRVLANRVELNARRFMRDLKRKAYIDIRL